MDLQTNTGQSESVLLTFAKFIFRSSSQFNDKIEKQIIVFIIKIIVKQSWRA